jgi:hypothetical protein
LPVTGQKEKEKMAKSIDNSLGRFFSYKAMKELAKFLSTYNFATQAIALDTNANDIQSTGTAGMMLNGTIYPCAEDAALDISADTEGTLTAWATATAYALADVRKNSEGKRFKCILAHTSSADTEPGKGAQSDMYWELSPHNAVNASGKVVTTLYERWVLITAKADGTLTVWLAGDQATIASASAKFKCPHYDPEMYCPVAIAKIAKDDAGDITIGTTALTGDITFYQVTGPVFPHPDNLDMN